MFSGIIEELGVVKSLEKIGSTSKIEILAPLVSPDTKPGQSICVNGVCLTVIKIKEDLLAFEIMQETFKRSNLAHLKQNDKVNLERALKADGRIDGHFVSGHIDETGIINKKQTKGGDVLIEVKASLQIAPYIALKGSIALDGVSLTVSAQNGNSFCVNLIPFTLHNTTLGFKKTGDSVNIECDILSRYIGRHLSKNRESSSNLNSSFLRQHGFI